MYYDDFTGFPDLQIAADLTVRDVNGNVDADKTAVLRQVEAAAPGTVQNAASNSFDWNSLVSNLTQLVGVVVQAEAQRDLLQVNLQRAQQGLPPINAQQYMPGVNVGVSQDTQKMIYTLGALGIGAVVLLSLVNSGGRNKRRR